MYDVLTYEMRPQNGIVVGSSATCDRCKRLGDRCNTTSRKRDSATILTGDNCYTLTLSSCLVLSFRNNAKITDVLRRIQNATPMVRLDEGGLTGYYARKRGNRSISAKVNAYVIPYHDCVQVPFARCRTPFPSLHLSPVSFIHLFVVAGRSLKKELENEDKMRVSQKFCRSVRRSSPESLDLEDQTYIGQEIVQENLGPFRPSRRSLIYKRRESSNTSLKFVFQLFGYAVLKGRTQDQELLEQNLRYVLNPSTSLLECSPEHASMKIAKTA